MIDVTHRSRYNTLIKAHCKHSSHSHMWWLLDESLELEEGPEGTCISVSGLVLKSKGRM
jgi:pentatricopeptide repeat protein